MASIQEWKQQVASEGLYYVGQDEVPSDGMHLFVVISRDKDLDQEELAERMKLTGVYVRPLQKNDSLPNMYPFIGVGKPLDIAGESGTKQVMVTMDTLEDLLKVEAVFASKWVFPTDVSPEKVAEIREAMSEVDRQRREAKNIYVGDTEVGPNRWMFLRVSTRPGTQGLRTELVRDILLDAGFKAFTPDTGLLGMLVSSGDWSKSGWTEVLFNPGNRTVKVSDLYGLFPSSIVVDRAPVGLYDIPFLREHQELIDTYFRLQQLEVATTGTGGAAGEVLTEMLKDLGSVVGYARYALWGAVGVGVIYLGAKAYSLLKESYRSVRR